MIFTVFAFLKHVQYLSESNMICAVFRYLVIVNHICENIIPLINNSIYDI